MKRAASPTRDAKHEFELWAVADSKPVPIGLIPVVRDQIATFRASALPKGGVTLAVSLEPTGGSPTGSPTGPILYHGVVLTD